MVENNPSMSIRKISAQLDLGLATVWRILRKDLKMYPYKPKTVQPLTQAHREGRLKFSRWILDQPPEFVNNMLWADEEL